MIDKNIIEVLYKLFKKSYESGNFPVGVNSAMRDLNEGTTMENELYRISFSLEKVVKPDSRKLEFKDVESEVFAYFDPEFFPGLNSKFAGMVVNPGDGMKGIPS